MVDSAPDDSDRTSDPGRSEEHRRPYGRALADFLVDLSPAEKVLLRATGDGKEVIVAHRRPEILRPDNRVRAEFIRFLALGGDAQAPVHERGIQLAGAFITGTLDLAGCVVAVPLNLLWCKFELGIFCSGASVEYLNLLGSELEFLKSSGAKAGSIKLNSRCVIRAGCDLRRATIEGELDCSGSKFEASGQAAALNCTGIRISGNVSLNRLKATGGILFNRARLGGELNCNGAALEHPGKAALSCTGARIDGTLYLSKGFRAAGEVNLRSSTIAGSLNCQSGLFDNPTGDALSLDGTVIERFFYFSNVTVLGCVTLVGARVGALCDDSGSWANATLRLNGFRYDRIEQGPTDAATRIAWLRKQPDSSQPGDFWPLPWEHLARILREMGHSEDARLVAMEKQRQMRKLGIIGNRKAAPRSGRIGRAIERGRIAAINAFTRTLHRLYGALAGYGYRPLRTVGWMMVMWAVAATVFTWGHGQGVFVSTKEAGPAKAGQHSPAKPSSFSPTMYALDVLLPLVDLKQEDGWAPAVERTDRTPIWVAWSIRGLMWAEIIFGWIASLLLVSAVGRLVQKD